MDLQSLTYLFVGISFTLYIGIAIWSRARSTNDFYIAGKGVSPVANGMATAADWMSAASFISMAGLIAFLGKDGSVYLMGWTGGYVLLALLLAPYLRKFGKYTVPDFIGTRYYSKAARLVAIICLIFISFTYVAGQMRGVGIVFSRFLEVDINTGVIIGMLIVFFYAVLGGMKGITYTQVAQYCVLIFAYMVPAIFISLLITNNPIPQLGFGDKLIGSSTYLLDKLDQLSIELGFNAYTDNTKSNIDIFCITAALMFGTAGLPHVIVRFFTVPSVGDARKSAGYALIFIALLYTTAPAVAAFAKMNLIDSIQGQSYSTAPKWFKNWEDIGLIAWQDKNDDGAIRYSSGNALEGTKPKYTDERGKYGERLLNNPLAAVQMGLIYVNPQGPDANPDPILAAHDIRETFGRMAMNDHETVALIAGGHTFGKTHGAADADQYVGAEPAGARLEEMSMGWKNNYGSGKGEHTITSGLEGAWTTTPTQWSNNYFENLFEYEWELTKGQGGAFQWTPKNGAGSGTVPDAHNAEKKHSPMMLTSDIALKVDPIYEPISRYFYENPDKFADAFAKAWFKLTHRDMGPLDRYLGPEVPKEELIWQDPIPKISHELIDDSDESILKMKILDIGLPVSQLISVAWASASTFRNSDKRGGANGGRISLSPQKYWDANEPIRLGKVLDALTAIKNDFNKSNNKKQLSLADLIVLAGYIRIMSKSLVDNWEGQIVNIHPSLLPKYPGLNTHRRALKAKDRIHGSTIHFVTSELDSGPIIRQESFEIEPSDTEESLINKVKDLEHKIYPETISFLIK